jgi:hypothetical protein
MPVMMGSLPWAGSVAGRPGDEKTQQAKTTSNWQLQGIIGLADFALGILAGRGRFNLRPMGHIFIYTRCFN